MSPSSWSEVWPWFSLSVSSGLWPFSSQGPWLHFSLYWRLPSSSPVCCLHPSLCGSSWRPSSLSSYLRVHLGPEQSNRHRDESQWPCPGLQRLISPKNLSPLFVLFRHPKEQRHRPTAAPPRCPETRSVPPPATSRPG